MRNQLITRTTIFRRNDKPVHPEHIFAAGLILLQANAGNFRQVLPIQQTVSLTHLLEFFSPLGLRKADGSMNVAHTVIEADICMQICARSIQGKTEIFIIAAGLGKIIITSDNHAAFTRSHVFIGEKAESGNARKRSSTFTAQRRPVGLRGILHENNVLVSADFFKGRHVAWIAQNMHCHNCLCAWCNFSGHSGRRKVPCRGVSINKDRHGTRVAYRKSRSHHGEIGYNNFITFADTKSYKSQMQSHSAIAYGNTVFSSTVISKRLFKSRNVFTRRRNPAGR